MPPVATAAEPPLAVIPAIAPMVGLVDVPEAALFVQAPPVPLAADVPAIMPVGELGAGVDPPLSFAALRLGAL